MKTTHMLKASVRAERVQRLASAEDFFKGNIETSDWGGRGRKGRKGRDERERKGGERCRGRNENGQGVEGEGERENLCML